MCVLVFFQISLVITMSPPIEDTKEESKEIFVPNYTCSNCKDVFVDERPGLFTDELDFFTNSEWYRCFRCYLVVYCAACSDGGTMCPICDE